MRGLSARADRPGGTRWRGSCFVGGEVSTNRRWIYKGRCPNAERLRRRFLRLEATPSARQTRYHGDQFGGIRGLREVHLKTRGQDVHAILDLRVGGERRGRNVPAVF